MKTDDAAPQRVLASEPVARLREFREADIEAARALWLRLPGIGLSEADEPEALAAYLRRNPGSSFVAEADREVVGTILCGHDGRRGLIHHLAVDRPWQRQGLGHALLDNALRALREAGIQKCHLMVYQGNAQGRAFWHAVGAAERTELALFSTPTGLAG